MLNFLLSFVFVILVIAQANAAPIYSQITPTEPGASFASNNVPVTGQKIADNFSLTGTQPVTVRSLRFIGGYGLRNPPPLDPPLDSLPEDDFRVVFLGDNGGSPGVPLPGGDFPSVTSFRRTATNGRLLSGITTPLEFIVNLGDGIELEPNTDYWLSIALNPNPDFVWAWARETGILEFRVASTLGDIDTGPWSVTESSGMWFELNDQNIPEPSSCTLFYLMAWITLMKRKLSDERFVIISRLTA